MNEMIGFWTNWIETVRFACEAQGVIVARLALLASGGTSAAAEADLMISEKVVAFADAKAAAEGALADGLGIYIAAERAYSPVAASGARQQPQTAAHTPSTSLLGRLAGILRQPAQST